MAYGLAESTNHKLIQFRGDEVQKLYWSIGQLADLLDVAQSLLRFWEAEFNIKIRRSRTGQRLYTRQDVETFKEIYRLVKVELFTLEGARRKLQNG